MEGRNDKENVCSLTVYNIIDEIRRLWLILLNTLSDVSLILTLVEPKFLVFIMRG